MLKWHKILIERGGKKMKEAEKVGCECNCEVCPGCGLPEEETLEEGILTFTDEEGKDVQFEILDVIELDDKEYLVVLPIDLEEDSEEAGVVILEIKQEDGEEVYDTVVNEEEAEKVFKKFQEQNESEDEKIEKE